jgi:hypothetical protein
MFHRKGITRRVVSSWIIAAAFALFSAAVALADGTGTQFPH